MHYEEYRKIWRVVLQAIHPIGFSTQGFISLQKLFTYLFLQPLWLEECKGYLNENEKGGQEMTPAEMCAWPVISVVCLYTIYAWVYELTNWFRNEVL